MPQASTQETLYTLIIFSENLAGVLTQVTGVFTRRQLNIESLNVSPSGFEKIHRYTITCRTDAKTIRTVALQLEKKIDVIMARYYTQDEVYVMEQALYKIASDRLIADREISKAIRRHDAKIVEVNSTYAIVSKEGLHEEVRELYRALKTSGCLLQYVGSGVVAVTKSRREELSEFLELRNRQADRHRTDTPENP